MLHCSFVISFFPSLHQLLLACLLLEQPFLSSMPNFISLATWFGIAYLDLNCNCYPSAAKPLLCGTRCHVPSSNYRHSLISVLLKIPSSRERMGSTVHRKAQHTGTDMMKILTAFRLFCWWKFGSIDYNCHLFFDMSGLCRGWTMRPRFWRNKCMRILESSFAWKF